MAQLSELQIQKVSGLGDGQLCSGRMRFRGIIAEGTTETIEIGKYIQLHALTPEMLLEAQEGFFSGPFVDESGKIVEGASRRVWARIIEKSDGHTNGK